LRTTTDTGLSAELDEAVPLSTGEDELVAEDDLLGVADVCGLALTEDVLVAACVEPASVPLCLG
jgi:hypothetical protein